MKNKNTMFVLAIISISFILCIFLAFYAQQKYLVNQLIAGIGNQESIEAILFEGASAEQIQKGLVYLSKHGYGGAGLVYFNHLLIEGLPMLILLTSSILFILSICLILYYQKKRINRDIEMLIQRIRNEDDFNVAYNKETATLIEAIDAVKMEHSRQLNEYKQMNRQQLNYLENITHQIKTPLTSLILLIDMCRLSDAETMKANLDEAEGICLQLNEITSLLLKVGKLRSNQKNLQYTKLNINELLIECIKMSAMKYPQINYTVNTSKVFYLWVDQIWMKEAFTNILDNCSRYSPNGSTVKISIDQMEHLLHITIEDEGCGIDEAEIDAIFNRYHQSKHEQSHFGIGLHLAKDIINAHCGQIKAYNKQPKGTCFEIKLAILQGEVPYNQNS